MKVAVIHPDLGIGGAERLIVDTALGLQRLGHTVHIYTSHHDPSHCFEETKDGTLTVRNIRPPLPRSMLGKGHILFAHLRQLHLTFYLLMSGLSFEYDVYIVDLLSTCIPLLRNIAHKRVVFYGHFPDKLLADGQFIEGQTGLKKSLSIKTIYRIPMDWLEEVTTRQADILLVNSKFTARIFKTYLSTIVRHPRVVYPGINIEAYDEPLQHDRERVGDVFSNRPTLLSLNRFEKKKNAALAVKAFAQVLLQLNLQDKARGLDKLRLVLAGGFDPRLQDNIDTVNHLTRLCNTLSLKCHITPPLATTQTQSTSEPDVILLLNFSKAQRTWLLTSPSTQALLYTPTNEHFGIIPIEGMISRLPVLACDSGGPTESIVDPDFSNNPTELRTGWLRKPTATAWSEAILEILRLSAEERGTLGRRTRQRAESRFSLDAMATSIEEALTEAMKLGKVQGHLLNYWSATMLSLFVLSIAFLGYFSFQ